MTIELNPVGVACNLQCPYCYQAPMREAGNINVAYDLEKIKVGLRKEGAAFSVFGGDSLLLPLEDLEAIFAFGLETYGSNGIQTNGALITDAHLALFQKYKVHVGLSLDGPDELNNSRWAGTLAKTRATTAKSMEALRALCAMKMPPSIIVTLYRGNAVGELLIRLIAWFVELEQLGVRHIRLHLLEVESEAVARQMALTTDENIDALLHLYEFQKQTQIQFDIFGEMARLLMGEDQQTTCIWNACDPYTTAAVRGVDGQGLSSNCGRTNKDGVNWQKAVTPGYERQLALYFTPQSDLGCQGCRFFFACKGQCPGTAEQRDWRNRSEHCAIWMALFEQIEKDLRGLGRMPLSRSPILPKLEATMLASWATGQNISIAQALARVQGSTTNSVEDHPHGDHWDAPDGTQHADGAIVIHGDAGRTEMHGDSNARLDTSHLGQ